MKKILIALLTVVALLAFTVSAFAMHGVKDMFEYTPQIVKPSKAQIELSGEIRVRGELSNNTSDFMDTDDDKTDGSSFLTDADLQADPDLTAAQRMQILGLPPVVNANDIAGAGTDDDKAAYDQRVRLKLKATVSPNTMGVVELESNSGGDDTWTWGSAHNGDGIYSGASDAKPTSLEIRQAYIAYQSTSLLGSLSGFKAGHMLLGLGNGLFYDHTGEGDDAIVLWTQPADNTELAFTIIKLKETPGSIAGSADDADAYVLSGETAMNGLNISGDITLLKDNSAPYEEPLYDDKGITLWNFGLRGDTSVSGFNVSADVEFQTGTLEGTQAGGDDMTLGGWALELKADKTVGDATVRAGFAYGSGDDIDSEDSYDGFINSISSGQHYTYLYDQKAATAGQSIVPGSTVSSILNYGNNTGLNNTWYLTVGASANVNPDTKVSADIYYLQASENVYDVDELDSKDIGVEIDGKVEYQIDTNLVYFVEGGYLFAGDFYKNITALNTVSTASSPDDPDNAYSVRHGVVLKF